jgi:hypothetical protein
MLPAMAHRVNRPAKRPQRKPPEPSEHDYRHLIQALADAEGLLAVLGRLLAEPTGKGPATGTIGRHAPESSEPWHSEAADAYWRIWFGARKLADRLRHLAGLQRREWGSGDTGAALSAIAGLATSVPPSDLAAAREQAESWVAGARRIRDIDEVETWTPLPRPPGFPPPCCPYCQTLSLRMAKGREEVRCFFPGCRDIDGNPTRARMELGRFTDAGHLVFGDGTVVAYREGHDHA